MCIVRFDFCKERGLAVCLDGIFICISLAGLISHQHETICKVPPSFY